MMDVVLMSLFYTPPKSRPKMLRNSKQFHEFVGKYLWIIYWLRFIFLRLYSKNLKFRPSCPWWLLLLPACVARWKVIWDWLYTSQKPSDCINHGFGFCLSYSHLIVLHVVSTMDMDAVQASGVGVKHLLWVIKFLVLMFEIRAILAKICAAGFWGIKNSLYF